MKVDRRTKFRLVRDPGSPHSLTDIFRSRLRQRDLNAAFRAYAEAMDAAQLLENNLALLLIGLQRERSPAASLTENSDLYGYLFRRTLGNLIKRLRAEIAVPAGLEAQLSEVLDLRNFIAHRYFRDRMSHWLLPSYLPKATEELVSIRMRLVDAAQQVGELHSVLCSRTHRDQAEFLQEFESKIIPMLVEIHQPRRRTLTKRSSRRGPAARAADRSR